MGKVALHFSISLDGFIAGPGISREAPMGEGGMRLHEWMFNEPKNAIDTEAVREIFASVGAVVLGKRTFDLGIGEWGDVPFPAPSFVVTHHARAPLAQKSGTFTFVDDGIESAILRARVAAGDKNVVVMGADVAQQALKAGLADELVLQLVPVLMNEGIRLFERLGTENIELELQRQTQSPNVMHLRYRVLK